MIKNVNEQEILKIIDKSYQGKNTNFLKASHSLWKRFKNYEKNPPTVLYNNNNLAVAVIFATLSKRTLYVNLYEIVTIQGYERKGYASKLWELFIKNSYETGMRRIKLSCTPSSIGFHTKNGLVYWAVDKQGSLRSDQPLMPSTKEQKILRNEGIKDYKILRPDTKIVEKFKQENIEYLNLSEKKLIQTMSAIQYVGKYWLRHKLYK